MKREGFVGLTAAVAFATACAGGPPRIVEKSPTPPPTPETLICTQAGNSYKCPDGTILLTRQAGAFRVIATPNSAPNSPLPDTIPYSDRRPHFYAFTQKCQGEVDQQNGQVSRVVEICVLPPKSP